MDYKSQTCCFTGHRDIAPYTPDTVFEQTKVVITLLVTKGFKYFGTGGALGFDTIAAQAVLSVKETHPEVKLILVLPCENQTKYWKQQDIDVYNDIKLRADKVKVLAPHYYNGCMQKRNRHLDGLVNPALRWNDYVHGKAHECLALLVRAAGRSLADRSAHCYITFDHCSILFELYISIVQVKCLSNDNNLFSIIIY